MIANTDGGVSPRAMDWSISHRSARAAVLARDAIEIAVERTSHWLLGRQHDDGYWVGELEGDTILESEYILLMAFLGRESDPACVRCARYIRDHQKSDGGWAIYPGGPTEISASVKAYFALKLVGTPPDDPAMVLARQAILGAGGAHLCNSFTRFYLALLGQIGYDECPCVPPELVLIPSRLGSAWSSDAFGLDIGTISCATFDHGLVTKCRCGRSPAELRHRRAARRRDARASPSRRTVRWLSWTNFFLVVDRVLKTLDRWAPAAWRQPAIKAAHRWMLDHCENTDGLGAIFPPMVYSIIALRCLDYDLDSPTVQWAINQLDDLHIAEDDRVRVQPCLSPVWDTAIASIALADARVPADHPAWARAVEWLLAKELRNPGDWQARKAGVEPTGWHFQFRNAFYPDLDDSAMVVLALNRSPLVNEPAVKAATRRGVNWLLSMQNRDGGWAAYDVDIDNQVLTQLPFADHNAMLDPSCADITARVIELLGTLGSSGRPILVNACCVNYLWSTQEPEGCWYGRWGVNYIYGTWQVLQGLKALDFPMDHPALAKAVEWLEATQQSSGAWGETCRSYDDATLKGTGEPTPSQTAWAALGLIAAGRAFSPAVRNGIDYLIQTQLPDGSWDEPQFIIPVFPESFYLRYHLYAVYFPLMAMARYQTALASRLGPPSPALACEVPA